MIRPSFSALLWPGFPEDKGTIFMEELDKGRQHENRGPPPFPKLAALIQKQGSARTLCRPQRHPARPTKRPTQQTLAFALHGVCTSFTTHFPYRSAKMQMLTEIHYTMSSCYTPSRHLLNIYYFQSSASVPGNEAGGSLLLWGSQSSVGGVSTSRCIRIIQEARLNTDRWAPAPAFQI